MLMFLGLASIWDVIKREIPIWYLTVGTLGVVVLQLVCGSERGSVLVFGSITGIIFLVISRLSREGVGYGDSWMIFILGIFLGIWKLLVVLGIAFLGATVVAGIGMAGHWFNRKSRIPFYPFLLIGFLGVWGW